MYAAQLSAVSTQATAAAAAAAAASGGANIAADAIAVLGIIQNAFVGSSYDATHQVILARAKVVANDPTLAQVATQQAWIELRCWAGDQTVITPQTEALLFGTGNINQGCGCEVAHGCRADAQQAVSTLQAAYPTLTTGNLSTSPYTNPVTGNPAPAPLTPGTPLINPATGLPYTTPIPLANNGLLLAGALLVGVLAFSGGGGR